MAKNKKKKRPNMKKVGIAHGMPLAKWRRLRGNHITGKRTGL